MNATNLITWDRYATLAATVAERAASEEITAPMLAKLAESKRRLDAPREPRLTDERSEGVHGLCSAAVGVM